MLPSVMILLFFRKMCGVLYWLAVPYTKCLPFSSSSDRSVSWSIFHRSLYCLYCSWLHPCVFVWLVIALNMAMIVLVLWLRVGEGNVLKCVVGQGFYVELWCTSFQWLSLFTRRRRV